jgi:Flp pilus assembly protein TadB
MPQQNRPIYVSLISTTLLSLLVGVFLFAKKRRAKSSASEKVVTHSTKTSPEETLAYWTEERMRHAQPAQMPMVDERDFGKRPSDSSHS